MYTVYIAGPFRGKNSYEVHCNVRAAEKLMHELLTACLEAQVQVACVCPHTMNQNFDGTFDDQYWLDSSLELLRRCDGVLLVPGWERSAGAQGEHELALHLAKPIFTSPAQVVRHLLRTRNRRLQYSLEAADTMLKHIEKLFPVNAPDAKLSDVTVYSAPMVSWNTEEP